MASVETDKLFTGEDLFALQRRTGKMFNMVTSVQKFLLNFIRLSRQKIWVSSSEPRRAFI
jgi:hypothetical protein